MRMSSIRLFPRAPCFSTALLYDLRVTTQAHSVEDVLVEIAASQAILNDLLLHLIDIGKADLGTSRSWPTLLKSQSFFEKVASFERGRDASAA